MKNASYPSSASICKKEKSANFQAKNGNDSRPSRIGRTQYHLQPPEVRISYVTYRTISLSPATALLRLRPSPPASQPLGPHPLPGHTLSTYSNFSTSPPPTPPTGAPVLPLTGGSFTSSLSVFPLPRNLLLRHEIPNRPVPKDIHKATESFRVFTFQSPEA